VGKAEKWASPFFGEELAVRCERSEHGKSQLSPKNKKNICRQAKLSGYSDLSDCAKLSTLFFFVSALLLGCARIASNAQAALRGGGFTKVRAG